jgi:competence protein ComEC
MAPRFLLLLLVFLVACSSGEGGPRALQSDAVRLIFLDVGQGDAVVIYSPEGKATLIDAGGGGNVPAQLSRHGIGSLDLAIATHPHADHIGGMAEVLREMPVRYYMDNGVPHTTETYRELMRTLQRSDVGYLEPTARRIELGSVTLRVLPPPSHANSHNNRSIGLVVEYGSFRALLTGDAEVGELNHFLSLGLPDVTVLKASHHGSRDGVTPAWLAATRPEVVVISCGRGNEYGYPDEWALRYYEGTGAAVFGTDHDGEVIVTAWEDGRFGVITAREHMWARGDDD